MEEGFHCIHDHLPSQVGGSPLHEPFSWHCLDSIPTSLKPDSHVYVATAPSKLPPLVSTVPLAGPSKSPQSIAIIMMHALHAIIIEKQQ